ncbi:MAG: potassium/proton antiporter [Longimicrobiales bacterium]
MFLVDRLILVGAILLLVGILSSKLSTRVGLPVLVLFIAVGMLAGEDGIGRIEFDNYVLAHGIGTLALAVILFDGGLRTPVPSIRLAWKPAFLLATVGVALTAAVTGWAASWMLGLPILYGLLLGSIVSSTDAAAVFSILRSGGMHLRRRLNSTLEIESGSNDPMAVLLTLGLVQLIMGTQQSSAGLVVFFIQQLVLGAVAGLVIGKLSVMLINRIHLGAAGLYPVLAAVCGLLAYGAAAIIGGNGFLSVYIAGIILGNSRIVFQRGTLLLHDGFAWIAQMVMFIMLGLLSTPSDLITVAPTGFLLALVLIFVARPAMVLVTMIPFGFRIGELAFLAWAGLKGAVPIILATYPLMFGVPDATLLFNLVFFVVIVSAIAQGWSLRLMAERIGVQGPALPQPPIALEISSLRHVEGDIVDYSVVATTRAAGRRLRELALPGGAVVALITRDTQIIPPRGSTEILPGDHVFIVLRPETRSLVDHLFRSADDAETELTLEMEFPLQGSTTVADLRDFYGMEIDAADQTTLDQVLHERLGRYPEVGDTVITGAVSLRVREMIDNRIEWVGLSVAKGDEAIETRILKAGE